MDRSVCIVTGYHPDTPVSELAIAHGLLHRFAVILGPFPESHGDANFDVELLLAVLTAIAAAVDHDSLVVEVDGNSPCKSLDDLGERYRTLPAETLQAPRQIRFQKGGALVCVEETEFWAVCGGPAPYSDSYTLSFYTREDAAERFEAVCRRACQRLGARVAETIPAAVHPVPRSLWSRLRQRLFGA